jgi:NAD(P)-dependent dehydrogenase (short-subunit alcohol dehydrogenase family)
MALMEKVSSGSGDGKRCVLITGCSAGIGFACAAYLVQQGYTVFAGVRKDADADRLKGLNLHNLIPVCPLDLKMTEQIDAAITFVKEELYKRGISGLYSLVNNAGGGFIAPLEIMDIGKFRAEFETRIMGPLILLQKCLLLSGMRAAGYCG